MNLRWLWFDYVDPQLNLTREQRRSVRRMAFRFVRENSWKRGQSPILRQVNASRWIDWVAPFIPGGCMFVMLVIGSLPASDISLAMHLPAYLIICWIITAALARPSWKPAVNVALREHGYDVCIKCGYLLRGLPTAVTHCPECGTKRDNPLIE